MIQPLESVEQAEDFLKRKGVVLIYKHSPRDNISLHAMKEVEAFVETHDIPVRLIDVLAHREVSNFVANFGQVIHQSPQVIFFKDGKQVWDASHHEITLEELEGHIP